jgi:predicted nucleic acid-binding protein
MRVVDTSAWIEWLLGTALGKRLEPELPPNDEWIVPTIVQYELMRASIRALSRAQADVALAFSNKLAVRQLDTDLAVAAVDYAARHSLAMADAIIYATAMKNGADLLTCDAHFASLPGVVYFAKSPSS